jgi:hypothetical protein
MLRRYVTIAVLAVSGFLSGPTHASCMVGSTNSFWPFEPGLPANGILIGQADGSRGDSMAGLAEQGPYLATEIEEVPLEVLATFKYGYGDVQVVLKPVRSLTVGRRYELRLRRALEGKGALSLQTWDRAQRKPVPLTWLAGPPIDEGSRWRGSPASKGIEKVAYGCGDDVHHRFAAPISAGAGWVLVESETDKYPGFKKRVLLPLEGQSVRVGHGMCGGPFRFEKGVRYRLRFSALDVKGELTAAPGAALEIVGTE